MSRMFCNPFVMETTVVHYNVFFFFHCANSFVVGHMDGQLYGISQNSAIGCGPVTKSLMDVSEVMCVCTTLTQWLCFFHTFSPCDLVKYSRTINYHLHAQGLIKKHREKHLNTMQQLSIVTISKHGNIFFGNLLFVFHKSNVSKRMRRKIFCHLFL